MNRRLLTLSAAFVATLFAMPMPASAGPITCPATGAVCIDESVEGATPTIITPANVTATITPVSVAVGEEWTITVSILFDNTADILGSTSPTGLLEPGTLLPSDILLTGAVDEDFLARRARFPLTLFSDNDLGQIGSSCATCTLIEDGTFQQMPMQFETDLVPSTKVFLKSDIDVPEPTSLVLLGTALVGFGVIRRRRGLRSPEL